MTIREKINDYASRIPYIGNALTTEINRQSITAGLTAIVIATTTAGCGLPSDFKLEAQDSANIQVNGREAVYSVKATQVLFTPYKCILHFERSDNSGPTTLIDEGCDHSVDRVVLDDKSPFDPKEKYDGRTLVKLGETMKQGYDAAVKAEEEKKHGDANTILKRVGGKTK